MSQQQAEGGRVRRLTESGLMLAFAFVLSKIPVIQMPFGGSVTAASMLPIILVAYRNGTRWGLFTGLAFALLQLLREAQSLSFATSVVAGAAIIGLDYLAAFTLLGLGGLFRRCRRQTVGLLAGTLTVCVLRYLCHVITGCTVWAGVSIPSSDGLIYSLAYNAAYMVPETLLTVLAAGLLSRVLDFRAPTLRRADVGQMPARARVCRALAGLLPAVAVAADALVLFAAIQTPDGFDITAIRTVSVGWLLGIAAAGALAGVILYRLARRAEKNMEEN